MKFNGSISTGRPERKIAQAHSTTVHYRWSRPTRDGSGVGGVDTGCGATVTVHCLTGMHFSFQIDIAALRLSVKSLDQNRNVRMQNQDHGTTKTEQFIVARLLASLTSRRPLALLPMLVCLERRQRRPRTYIKTGRWEIAPRHCDGSYPLMTSRMMCDRATAGR